MPYENTSPSCFNSILILSNAVAGKGKSRKVASQISSRLTEMNLSYEHHLDNWPHSLDKYSCVFLVGGDGTLNYFINRYLDVQLPIALFKGGSGNDFAWQLYGNISVDEYFERVVNKMLLVVDAARCNERLFINGFGIGFDAAIVQSMGRKKRFSAGHIAYLYTVLIKVLFYKESEISFTIDDEVKKSEVPFLLAVANGSRYGGGFLISPKSAIDDGELNLVLIKKIAPLKRVFKIPLVQTGRHLSLHIVQHRPVKSVLVEAAGEAFAHCDGELVTGNRFQIDVLPGQFKFFV